MPLGARWTAPERATCAQVEVEVWEPWTGSVSVARTGTSPTPAPIDSVRLSAGVDRWPLGGPPVSVWVGGLPDLDDVAVRISDVATDLVLVLFRRRQELRAPGAPFGVHGVDVRDPDIEEAADPVGVAWCLKGDRWLVVGGTSADVDDDVGVGECNVGRLWAEHHR